MIGFRVWISILPLFCAGCSFIRFEVGPYVVRDVEVVYSDQEDTTFFFWKLRSDAIVDNVSFELALDETYEPIDLARAPFPATPFDCAGEFICFQFQVAGRYERPDVPPIRSVHSRDGVFAGSAASFDDVGRTFAIDPIAINNNEHISVSLVNYFADQGYQFRREFELSFVPRVEPCAPGETWERFAEPFDVDYQWVEVSDGACVNVRPKRNGEPSVWVSDTIVPSAETSFAEQVYIPPVDDSPVVYSVLLDMEIPSEIRCTQVTDTLLNTIDRSFQGRNSEYVPLGVFRPTSSETGEELSGCEQEGNQRFPIQEIIADAQLVQLQFAPRPIRVVFVYVNNSDIPPSDAVVAQLVGALASFDDESDLRVFSLGIGSNVIIGQLGGGGFPGEEELGVESGFWSETIGWRPVEDDTFRADIRAFANRVLPFRTMEHEDNTDVSFQPHGLTEDPQEFKVCRSTPVALDGVGPIPGGNFGLSFLRAPWPEDGEPFFRVTLEPQVLVPREQYVVNRISVVTEYCTRFCDNPFQNRGGQRFSGWSGTRTCQWNE